jgi:hypothetical protein
LEYILSESGQKLPVFKVGAPDGPIRAALCRTSILKTVYSDENMKHHNDPSINPYTVTRNFVYRGNWTKPVFASLSYIFKMAFLDAGEELALAWQAIINARAKVNHRNADMALMIMLN